MKKTVVICDNIISIVDSCQLAIDDVYNKHTITDIQVFDKEKLFDIIEEKTRQKLLRLPVDHEDLCDSDQLEQHRLRFGDWSWGYVDRCTKCKKMMFSKDRTDPMYLGVPGELLCEDCLTEWRKSNLKCDIYSHNWGIIIPGNTGIWFEQQTCGVCCNHIKIQGTFIPLEVPRYSKSYKNMLENLSAANYDFKNTDKLWKKIDKEMYWNYDVVDAPNGQPHNQEGILWVKFKEFPIPKDNDGNEESRFDSWSEMRQFLLGKTVCLIYPNCD